MSTFMPEILAPAGSLEKLKVAILYGANAVYLGGQKFGLRSAADNFTNDEIEEGVKFAHERGAKVYVVLNSFLHDKELLELPEFISFLEKINIDGVIVSDLGVIRTINKTSKRVPIHLSTQASCLNSEAVSFWKEFGVTRVVLGREVSISEAAQIKKKTGLEVELFIHGSMCMTYSGNCVISNFTQGRDSNRGGCAQSCRFSYKLETKERVEDAKSLYFMSSRDLRGLDYLEQFIEGEIDSLKIEGRMRSHLYVGTIVQNYASALEHMKQKEDISTEKMMVDKWKRELTKVSHRDYCSGNLVQRADEDSIYYDRESGEKEYALAGNILEVSPSKNTMIMEVRYGFNSGEKLEVLPFKGDFIRLPSDNIQNLLGEKLTRTKPGTLVRLPYNEGIDPLNIVRVKVSGETNDRK